MYRKRKRQEEPENPEDPDYETEYDMSEECVGDEDCDKKKRKRGLLILKKKKRTQDEEKLEAMENKLKLIENLIIQDALKYTGAHEGKLNI